MGLPSAGAQSDGSGTATTFRRRAETCLSKPSLQGALCGKWSMAAQMQADETGAPGRMFPAQCQGLITHWVGQMVRQFAAPVSWKESGLAMSTKAADQMSDAPHRQIEGLGDHRSGLTALMASHDRQTQRVRDGSWHRTDLTRGKTTAQRHSAYRPDGKTKCRI